MGFTNFPHGITSFGIPIIGSSGTDIPVTTGSYFFVSSTTGSDVNTGTEPTKAFATLDYALSKCTANKMDVVVLMPGHSETITGAGGITLDVAGVKVVGMGSGSSRPTFLMDGATTVTMLVTAADCSIENCIFKAGHADIVMFAHITAKNFVFKNNSVIENVANENFITCISIGTEDNDSDGCQIIGSDFIQGDAADLHAIIINKDQNDVKIIGNKVIGLYDASPYSAIYSPSTEVLLNFFMAFNTIYNKHNDNNTPTVNLACTTSTGWVVYNTAQGKDNDGETHFLGGAGGLCFSQNYAAGVAGTASGYLYPGADS